MLSPHRLFLWSLVAGLLLSSPALAQEGEVESTPAAEVAPEQGRRELWGFFSLLALIGSAVPCPPFGDPHDKCVATREANQAEADYTAANGSNWVAAEEADANYQYENVEEADTTEYNGQDTASGGGFANASKGFQFWMIATMGSVLGAMIAIHIGQKKNRPNGQGHEMSGAVARRMGAVSAFAEGAFPCATKEQMGVEMQGQEVETGYQLEVGPEGVETRPGFAMV